MPNNYFQFKQFTIYQENCAMKVCTDSCLFGAWVAEKLRIQSILPNTILDIGTGTGLLSLMLAQETNAKIDAVEIDKPSFLQAFDNIKSSPWQNNITIYLEDINQFSANNFYDIIISNPPFFEKDLKSKKAEKNIAHHSELLTLKELFYFASKSINIDGFFFVLLPFSRKDDCYLIAFQMGFHLVEEITVYQSENHSAFRSMLMFSKKNTMHVNSVNIYIKNEGTYSDSFIQFLKPYYLNF